jgi:6-pyruvoyl-tetrahydropterin synthase
MMGTYEVSVDHAFNARHAVRLPDGSWEAPHCHLWRVTATFRSGRLEEATGVVIDFLDVQRALEKIDRELQGADLNELAAFEGRSPSAERVAEHIAACLAARLGPACGLYGVRVTEAPGCSAAFYPAPREPK